MEIENLSKQMQDKLAKILSEDVDVISFDIFDTLLLRPVTSPQDIFRLAGKAAGVASFSSQRSEAAEKSKESLTESKQDYLIWEIYETYSKMFNCSSEEAERLAEIEMQVEYDLLYPRKSVQLIYNEVLKSGKEIIITSDMYLPAEFLRKVLDKNGYTGYQRIYVSGEEKVKKSGRGDLYKRVAEHYQADRILHMGDNYKSDFENAKKANFKAVYIESTMNAFRSAVLPKSYLFLSESGKDNSFLHGISANCIFDDPRREFDNQGELLGYTAAPFVSSYDIRTIREAK
jgi:predicted HAD superfamily hydrolase